MSRSWVRRAEPWTIAATPPTMMSSTPARLRAGRICSRSITEGLPSGSPHSPGKGLEPHQIAQPLLDGLFEVLPEKSPVDVFLVGLDDWIGLEGEPLLVHGSTLPDSCPPLHVP